MNMRRILLFAVSAILAGVGLPVAAQSNLDQKVDSNINDWVGTYKYLHEHPELSTEEKATSEMVASALKKMGYDVTDHFGKYEDGNSAYGVVAVLRNGSGPTLYIRTDMDALPVTENTGLPYASKVREKRPNGEVGVMHACGHDLHMTVLSGHGENDGRNQRSMERHAGADRPASRGNRGRRGGNAARGPVHKIPQAGLRDCLARFFVSAGRESGMAREEQCWQAAIRST